MQLAIFMCFAFAAFAGFSLRKFYQYAQNPLNNRWELYPVPHEPGARGRCGGSYYEEAEWWTKPRQVSCAGRYKEMLKDILFMRSLFINRRKYWCFSYPMHLGIYLLSLFTLLLFAGAITELSGLHLNSSTIISSHPWARLLYFGTAVTGFSGAALAAWGSASLFLHRVSDVTLRKYSGFDDYFNLVFIFAAAISGLAAWSTDTGFNYSRDVVEAMLTLTPVSVGVMLTVHLILNGSLLIYIPLTKMSHYIGKYFAYHKVLWDNEPNLRGSAMEVKIKKALSRRPQAGWSSPHTNSTGEPEEFMKAEKGQRL